MKLHLPYPFNRPRHGALQIHTVTCTSDDRQDEKPSEAGPRARKPLIALPPDPVFSSIVGSFAFPTPPRRKSNAFTNFTTASEEEALKVVVIGTGFAGLASAIACAREGFQVTVLERTNGQSPHGDSVIIGANAARLLYRWGIEDVCERASSGRWMIFQDEGGRTLHREDLATLPSLYGGKLLQGRRTHFLASMGIAARLAGVKIDYETEAVGYADLDQPAVLLASGELREADVIIVCDGINSTSRCLLNDNKERRRSGQSIHRAVMDSDPIAWDPICSHLLDGNIRTWLGKDEYVSIFPMDNGRQIAFTYTHRDSDSSSTMSWRSSVNISDILHRLSAWDPTLQRAISKFPRALHWTIVEGEVAEKWISKGGKIALAGDAVHPLIPASMLGATMAIEDAETIAQCLSLSGGSPEGVALALQAYEKLRKPRVDQAARLGRKQATIYETFTSRNATASQSRSSSLTTTSSAEEQPSSTSSAFSADPLLLKPLAFSLYSFDATAYAQDNWEAVVRQLDPTVEWDQAAEVDPLDADDAEGLQQRAWMKGRTDRRARRGSLAFTTESFAVVSE